MKPHRERDREMGQVTQLLVPGSYLATKTVWAQTIFSAVSALRSASEAVVVTVYSNSQNLITVNTSVRRFFYCFNAGSVLISTATKEKRSEIKHFVVHHGRNVAEMSLRAQVNGRVQPARDPSYWGSCYKYNFCHDKSFVAIKHVFCYEKSMLATTNLLSRQNIFVSTNRCLLRQLFCHNKSRRVLSRQK